jgi:NTP pyrophosphatase (non-canonical NTP hydrolase)
MSRKKGSTKRSELKFGKLNKHQDEVLTILQEECAEVIQVCSKIKRFGLENYSPFDPAKVPNWQKLTNEIGDVLAMVEKVINGKLMMTEDGLLKAAQAKKEKLKRYMNYPTAI